LTIQLKANGHCLSQNQLLNYVRNNVLGNDRDRIESHLLKCELCYDAYEGITALDKKEDAQYHLNSISQNIKIKLLIPGKGNWRLYLSTAAMFIIICTAVLLLFNPGGSSVFEEYFKPYPNVIPMVRGEGTDFDLKAAMILYNAGKYEEAITEFDKIISVEQENELALFYKGVSLLALGNGKSARNQFESVIKSGSSMLKDQTQWYLGLSFILEDKVDSARNVFSNIKSSQNYYSEKASELLKNLDK
jgi:tetratricopeptide (TPR) repeat protein